MILDILGTLVLGFFVFLTIMLYLLSMVTLLPILRLAAFWGCVICAIGFANRGTWEPAVGFCLGAFFVIMARPARSISYR